MAREHESPLERAEREALEHGPIISTDPEVWVELANSLMVRHAQGELGSISHRELQRVLWALGSHHGHLLVGKRPR